MTDTKPVPFDLSRIPELATIVAMPGASRRAEVGGQSCSETGIIIATIMFGG